MKNNLQNTTKSKPKVTIYTDGACSGNPGIGGWAAILVDSKHELELNGFDAMTTNNRMELMGVICGLEKLKLPCEVEIVSDSAYVVNAFNNNWLESWQKNGWRKADKKEVLNVDLWQRLLDLLENHSYKFTKVAGHAGHVYNERCDALARAAIDDCRIQNK